uniref:Retrovirus-related Pol polyprotein from transposon TNT 1-94 n=1 Tax=Cajanus cajan TaxID=3821 RepID=A0A151RV39_CAJCA|nr:Retrovirus-related Pol polyprotein from transposon TNT 1-94 [Cajanus cajan]
MNDPANITNNVNFIPVLNGSNFKSKKDNVLIVLRVMDLDLALKISHPYLLQEMEMWEKSNRMSIMIMKKAILEAFRSTISVNINTAKEFLAKIEKRFVKNEKSEIGTLLANLISKTYMGKGNIREYIMEMSHIASKLKELKLELFEDLLVYLVLIFLPTQFGQFKVSYNKNPYELWTGKKSSLKHLHVWSFPAEARPYRPNEKKLDLRTISCYFVGYSKRSRGYKSYDPNTMSNLLCNKLFRRTNFSSKTTFLNGNIDETIYMMQLENLVSKDSKNLVCKLKKSIYGLKQASRQWYFKFHHVITLCGFEVNLIDDCIYHKFYGSKYFFFLVLYVDDILLASNDIYLLHETKRFIAKNFEMKDLGNASFVLGIQIHRDCSRGILRFSKKGYIEYVLKRYDMQDCKLGNTPVAKGDNFSLAQCPKNDFEEKEM